jgi:hypothetical protein
MIRKSFKSLINWGEKNLETTIYDHENITWDLFENFRQFHIKVAGRETRPIKTWELQCEAIKRKEAFLIFCKLKGELVSAQFVLHNSTVAYYGVGVMNRELMKENIPLGHWPIIVALKKLEQLKVPTFVLSYTNKSRPLSDKDESIHKFKTGFTKTKRYKLILELSLKNELTQ